MITGFRGWEVSVNLYDLSSIPTCFIGYLSHKFSPRSISTSTSFFLQTSIQNCLMSSAIAPVRIDLRYLTTKTKWSFSRYLHLFFVWYFFIPTIHIFQNEKEYNIFEIIFKLLYCHHSSHSLKGSGFSGDGKINTKEHELFCVECPFLFHLCIINGQIIKISRNSNYFFLLKRGW